MNRLFESQRSGSAALFNNQIAPAVVSVVTRLFETMRSGGNALFNDQILRAPIQDDTENPVLPGTLSVSLVTSGGFTAAWNAASDNVGVIGYEVSADLGTPSYILAGNNLTKTVTGLLPATLYTVRVRAMDAAGNRSAVLTTTVTTAVQPILANVVQIAKQAVGLVVEPLSQITTSPLALLYAPNTGQELVLYNKSVGVVTVTLVGSAAGLTAVKGAITKTLDLSQGLTIVVPPAQFVTLKLDNAAAYLKGDVSIKASNNGAIFAGVLQ